MLGGSTNRPAELGVAMTDLLIRDVPDDGLAAIDAKAKRVGLSRAAYLRRALERLATLTADLDDPAVMSNAWS